MTLAQDALTAGHAALQGHFPTPAHYSAPNGATVSDITITIDTALDEVALGIIGTAYLRTARFLVRAAQVAAPIREGVFMIASGANAGSWSVRQVRALTGGNWECLVGSDEQKTLTAPAAGWPSPLSE